MSTTKKETPIVFTITVSDDHWDPHLRGWRCPALRIPSAEVEAVYVNGTRVDSISYNVWPENEMIRWSSVPQPQSATIVIKLTEQLSTKKRTNFWKGVSALAPIIAALVTALISLAPWGAQDPPEDTGRSEPVAIHLSSPVYGASGTVTIYGSVETQTKSSTNIPRLIWNWGDSAPIEGSLPATHRYSKNGQHAVTVDAYIGNKVVGSGTIVVNVTNVTQNSQ